MSNATLLIMSVYESYGHSKEPFSTLFHSAFTFKVKFHYNSRHVGVKLKTLFE